MQQMHQAAAASATQTQPAQRYPPTQPSPHQLAQPPPHYYPQSYNQAQQHQMQQPQHYYPSTAASSGVKAEPASASASGAAAAAAGHEDYVSEDDDDDSDASSPPEGDASDDSDASGGEAPPRSRGGGGGARRGGGAGGGRKKVAPSRAGDSDAPPDDKKSRITQACDHCRRRKRKCDGTQPACLSCAKLGLACSYQIAVKKRGPQAGVVKRLRQEVKQLESELNREKKNAKLAKFVSSGLAIPEAKQQQLQQQQTGAAASGVSSSAAAGASSAASSLKQHASSAGSAASSARPPAAAAALPSPNDDSFTTLSLSAAANSRVRNSTYLSTYFTLLNNTMFPLLEEKAFYAEQKRVRAPRTERSSPACMYPHLSDPLFRFRSVCLHSVVQYEDDPSLEVPLSWNLRFAAALSVGSIIYGDTDYASSAARVARHAAAQLFDQPDPQVLRGMLVLAFHCLSTNQQSRAACYLAVATRMCCLVDISPEIPGQQQRSAAWQTEWGSRCLLS